MPETPSLRIVIAPVHGAGDAPAGVFVDGLLVPSVRGVIRRGDDILVVLDPAAVRIDPALLPPAAEAKDGGSR